MRLPGAMSLLAVLGAVAAVVVVAAGWFGSSLWTARATTGFRVDTSAFALIEPVSCAGLSVGNDACILLSAVPDSNPFLRRDSGGGVTLHVPARAATTVDSDHPRCELRSRRRILLGSGVGSMTAEVALSDGSAPQDVDAIVGQLHGSLKDHATAIAMLHFEHRRRNKPGYEFAVTVKTGAQSLVRRTLLPDLELGDPVRYVLSVDRAQVSVVARARGEQASFSTPVPAAYRGMAAVFMVGNYRQNRVVGPGGTTVAISYLSLDLPADPAGTPLTRAAA